MSNNEKIALLEEILDLESGELTEDTNLAEVETWDSMSKLSLIVLMDDEFEKKLSGAQIRDFVTVKDILDYMG